MKIEKFSHNSNNDESRWKESFYLLLPPIKFSMHGKGKAKEM